MIVRDLTGADLPEVTAIEAAVFGDTAWSAAAWAEEAAAASAQRRYLVAESDATEGGIAGYAGVLLAGSDADVLTLAVDPAQRRSGIGRALLDALRGVAEAARAQSLFLEVAADNAAAIGLYQASGFTELGERRHYYGPGRHAVTMSLRLREPLGARLLGERA